MSLPEDPWWCEFIAASPARTAKLAVVSTDGSPRVAPVWAVLDGDDLLFTTGKTTAKGTAIRRDPRVALCWDDERPPFAFVIVHGRVALSEDLDEVRHWATVIGGRFMGEERAAEYGARNGVPGELLVRVTPTKVIAAHGVAN
jgi:PPOX class probable F420-dependent enzyme